jgi:Short C-terminal domain
VPLRRRRPIARMATTAVVAGTAAHMGARSAQRSAAADQDQDQAPPAPAAADEAAAPEAAESPEIEQLKQFAALKDQGILTEEEFSAKKAQILGL